MRVLLVENAGKAASGLAGYFLAQGARAEVADTGEEALELVRHYEFDIMVLDLALPDMEGSTVIIRMRAARKSLPVLALAGTLDIPARIKAFAAGADDVVARPVDRAELLARMRAIVRRSRGHSHPTLQCGKLTINFEQQKVTVDGIEVHLTVKEFAVLQLLMVRKNMVLTKAVLLSNLYGGIDEPEIQIIDVFVCKIRSKLAKAGATNVISTVWGRGYIVRDAGGDTDKPASSMLRAPRQEWSRDLIVPAVA